MFTRQNSCSALLLALFATGLFACRSNAGSFLSAEEANAFLEARMNVVAEFDYRPLDLFRAEYRFGADYFAPVRRASYDSRIVDEDRASEDSSVNSPFVLQSAGYSIAFVRAVASDLPRIFSSSSNMPDRTVGAPDAILASGSWNADATDNWSNSARWLGGIIADGAGSTGNFTFNITTSRVITLDGAVASRTLGIMNIGDSTGGPSNYTLMASGGGTLTFDNSGSNAQLNQTSTSGNTFITVPIILNSSLDITNAAAAASLNLVGGITAGTAGTKTITTSNGLVTSTNVIGDGSGVIAVTQNGTGTLALGNSANTYSGGTTLAGGKITIGGSGTPLGSGTLTLSGGTLVSTASRGTATATDVILTADSALTTTSTAATVAMPFSGTLTGTGGTLTIRNDASATTGQFDVRFSGGNSTMSRPIVIDNGAGGGTARLSDFNTTGTTHTYSGVISGNGSFNRSASAAGTGGKTIFTVANTYSGGTSLNNGGTLLANNTTGSGTGTGAVTVTGTGSTLGGTGTISGAVTVNANAKVQGGDGTTGTTLTLGGALTMNTSSIIQLALGASGTHSTLARTGGTWTFASAQAFTFIDLGAAAGLYDDIITGLAGTPNTLPSTWTITNSGWTGTFAFDAINNSIDLTLVAVPEPGTWAAGVLALSALLYSQRRRFLKRLMVVS